jgi:hypothetical protein
MFTSLFAAAAIVGGLAIAVPADAGSKHKKDSCNWNGCSTQYGSKHKQVNLDLRVRVVVVHQNCNGQACAGGATTGYANSYANKTSAAAAAGGSTDSYAGAGPSRGQIGINHSSSRNSAGATATDGASAGATSNQSSTSAAAAF